MIIVFLLGFLSIFIKLDPLNSINILKNQDIFLDACIILAIRIIMPSISSN